MPEIEITPEQRDRLRSLQEDIARDVVGKYGHVRPKDAIEYLLDQYERDDAAGVADIESTSGGDSPTVEAASDAETTDADPPTAAPDDESGAEADAAPDDRVDAVDAGDVDAAEDGAETATDGEAVARVVGDDPESETGADASSNGESSSDGATTSTGDDTETTSESAAGGSMLDQMLSLLETHDDKWGEASAADERYAVSLPDGSTEHVRTKDDVKALLFKHYR
jgi:hypothetical protein